MSRPNEFSIGEAIEMWLRKSGLKEESLIQGLITEWPRIMGKPIAENTEKLWFREGIFYIKVKHPVWRQELAMAKDKIKGTLNKEMKTDLIQEVKII